MRPRWRACGLALLAACAEGGAAHADEPWCAVPRVLRETARDDFAADGPALSTVWRLEAESAQAEVRRLDGGVLDVRTPAGLSLWWRQALQGDYALRFEARALPAPASAGALAGRVSDLNLFWNATEAVGQMPRPRDGRFASYDTLRTYYLGYGANGNRTTRLRAYDGLGQRLVLSGWADAPLAEPGDDQGAMTEATRLQPGRWISVQLVSHTPRGADTADTADTAGSAAGVHGQLAVDGRPLFRLARAQPLLRGWFALRTTASHLQIRHFRILHCQPP